MQEEARILEVQIRSGHWKRSLIKLQTVAPKQLEPPTALWKNRIGPAGQGGAVSSQEPVVKFHKIANQLLNSAIFKD